MEELKRITPGEAKIYRELSIYDENVCKQATHFTLTLSPIPNPDGSAWEEVTYYTSIGEDSQYPLLELLKEWNQQNTREDKDNGNLPGENPFSPD